MARKQKGDGARPAISKSKLMSLMSSARSTKNDIAEIRGTYGSEIANAVENNYLDKKVFRQRSPRSRGKRKTVCTSAT